MKDTADVKERSASNNRGPERSQQDAWTINQPASCGLYNWRQTGEGPGLNLQRVLCT